MIRRYSVLTVIFLHLAFFCGAPGPAHAFILGDSNGDNLLNLADPVYLLNHLYRGGLRRLPGRGRMPIVVERCLYRMQSP